MAQQRPTVVIDLAGSDSDENRSHVTQSHMLGERTPRPAFISPRMSQKERQPPTSHSKFFSPKKSPPSEDSDLEKIPASSFTFRKSKDGPFGKMQQPEDNTTVAAVLARRRSSQTTNSDKASYEQRGFQSHSHLRAPREATASALTVPAPSDRGPVPQPETLASITPASKAPNRNEVKNAGAASSVWPTYRHVNGVFSDMPQDTVSQTSTPTSQPSSNQPEPLANGTPATMPPVHGHPLPIPHGAVKRKAVDDGTSIPSIGVTKRARLQNMSPASSGNSDTDTSVIHSSPVQLHKLNDAPDGSVSKPQSVSSKSAVPFLSRQGQVGSPFPSWSNRYDHSVGNTKPPTAVHAYAPTILNKLTGMFKSKGKDNPTPPLDVTQPSFPVIVESIEKIDPIEPDQEDEQKDLSADITGSDPNVFIDADDDDDYQEELEEEDVEEELDDVEEGLEIEQDEDGKTQEKSHIKSDATVAPLSIEVKPRPHRSKGQPFEPEDDLLLVHLKEVLKLRWAQINDYFPGRSFAGLQTRYSVNFSKSAKAREQALATSDAISAAKTAPKKHPTERAPVSTAGPDGAPRRTRGRPKKSAMSNVVLENTVGSTDTESAAEGFEVSSSRRLTRRSGLAVQTSMAVDITTPQASSKHDELKETFHQLRQTVSEYSCDRKLRTRQLGLMSHRSHPRMLLAGLRDYGYSTLGPARYMDDASGDVSTIAWSPNGKFFAAGGVAITDLDCMEYNKPKNLVIGDAPAGHVQALPHHRIPRPLVEGGVNATEAMRNSQDPHLYTTVQSVAFSANGRRMYSVSVDHHLNVYKVSRDSVVKTKLTGRSTHTAPVDLLSVSSMGPVATGCRHSGPGSIQVFPKTGAPNGLSANKVTSSMKKFPSALRFGFTHLHSKYLLAGFSCEAERVYEEDDIHDKGGETCLWNVETCQPIELGATNRTVFDLTWNPHASVGSSLFAVASGATGKVNKGMHSVVRLYNPDQDRARAGLELECPAWDLNDVIYSPLDENIIAAGSTDGKVFIWDTRQVKNDQGPLRVLQHGNPVSVLPHEKRRWEADTGIRFLSWGADHTRLYSGSSDGVVKCWDPYRSNEDKHIRDVVTFRSAIMSGAVSPDFESLLIGEDLSRLNHLTIGNEERTVKDMEKFVFHEDRATSKSAPSYLGSYAVAHDLLESGEIETRQFGALPIRQAVQGPNYKGPFNSDPDASNLRRANARMQAQAAEQYDNRQLFFDECSPCHLDCKHTSGFATQEDIDSADSYGRYTDRIPEALCQKQRPTKLAAVMLGLIAKCGKCGAAARPADDNSKDNGQANALCERCNFSCFRCAKPARISKRKQVIECLECRLAWRIGVLGYELIEDNDAGALINKRMKMKKSEAGICELSDKERERQFEIEV